MLVIQNGDALDHELCQLQRDLQRRLRASRLQRTRPEPLAVVAILSRYPTTTLPKLEFALRAERDGTIRAHLGGLTTKAPMSVS
ncbi:MAG TPA: hypothetical protein VKP88_05860 [Candidatus Paceibacterota bacterium]|nr:hypothetical protein [Candidatus Paceibacterota bacterium]